MKKEMNIGGKTRRTKTKEEATREKEELEAEAKPNRVQNERKFAVGDETRREQQRRGECERAEIEVNSRGQTLIQGNANKRKKRRKREMNSGKQTIFIV